MLSNSRKRAAIVSIGLLVAVVFPLNSTRAADAKIDEQALVQTAVEETLEPIRPGIPGQQPFWNDYSKRGFIYAPAFDFKEVVGAKKYRFSLNARDGNPPLTFEADSPWSALSPVWKDVPVGFVSVKVEGVDGEKVLGEAGARDFYRKAAFAGRFPVAARGYKECGTWNLKHLFASPHVQYWLDHNEPDPKYGYYCYPSKMIGAVMVGLVRYSRLAPETKEKSLLMARHAADFLILISEPETSKYPFVPPTYRGEAYSAKGQNDVVMMVYPEEVARGYLDLFDATQDRKYYDAADRIAQTYAKTQLPGGTWPIKVRPATGLVVSQNLSIPINIVRLFHRFDKQYGQPAYRTNRKLAMDWIIANPVKTFNWEGQFEDVGPSEPYKNLSKGQACDVAAYMLENSADNPHYKTWAMEIIRYAEDQFVVWDKPDPDLKLQQSIIPFAMEQYGWMMPINASATDMINAWRAAYKATGQELFRRKAQALANAMTRSQLPDGELPTYWHHTNDRWLNCSVYSAVGMIDLEEAGIVAKD